MSVEPNDRKRTDGERCALATGSLPVWAVLAFCDRWDAKVADGYERARRSISRGAMAQGECIMLNAKTREGVIKDLRAELGRWTERQPEENNVIRH
jgi:hypothetical protein